MTMLTTGQAERPKQLYTGRNSDHAWEQVMRRDIINHNSATRDGLHYNIASSIDENDVQLNNIRLRTFVIADRNSKQ
eukprot:CAMPEP_0172484294 /NCGR_PEP_ID=MMETSP1066-20121228/11700_1 /TAXON_ID=671091 /ORGANISM="Coscinodiscus wailesii, Strain CCMP2513" /LENGTH=76 /DNA_ID=CAMNT_0013248699 /DNA_START=948 /DNA_END=1178 /DNA_ORIENTATION=+